jgi:hypothetical protein
MPLLLLVAVNTADTASAGSNIDTWVAQVNDKIKLHAREPDTADTGMATVSFRCDGEGHPIDVKVSGDTPAIARAAISTIKALGTLPPLPAYVPAQQRITFKFLVGGMGNDDDYHRALDTMIQSAKRVNLATARLLEPGKQLASSNAR